MSFVPAKLREVSEGLGTSSESRRETVRSFLEWFGVREPGHFATLRIRQALDEVGLNTYPDFAAASLDAPIGFVKRASDRSGDSPDVRGLDGKAESPQEIDPAYRLSSLSASNRPPTAVAPTGELSDAISIMMRDAFSQLPVMTGRQRVHGMISWRSIGKTLHFRQGVTLVSDCVEPAHELSMDRSIFDAVPMIIEYDYVLVRNPKNHVTGIVTAADLSAEFRLLAEPFLLVGEIEKYLRRLVDRHFAVPDIASARNPGDERHVARAGDLTFGELKRFLENPLRWGTLNPRVGREVFVDTLTSVGRIRNDVMHFRAQEVPAPDLQTLQKAGRFFRELAGAAWI